MHLWLSLRLLRGSGRSGAVRMGLIVLGTALGVFLLLVAMVFPQVLRARQERGALRQPASVQPGERPIGRYAPLERRYGTLLIEGFLVAPTVGSGAPPGVKNLPPPGHAVVSPELRTTLQREPALRSAFPYVVDGVIGPQGLAKPDELFAWVGATSTELPGRGYTYAGYGTRWKPVIDMPSSALRLLGLAFLGLTAVPLAVYFAVCARLSAATRDRRLAALRLLGMSARDTARVASVEAVAAAAMGALLGVGAYLASAPALADLGIGGLVWFPEDGHVGTGSVLLVLIGVPIVSLIVARVGARPAVRDALATRRRVPASGPRPWRLLPLAIGLGSMTGLWLIALRLPPGVGFGSDLQLMLVAAVVATGLGLGLGLAHLAATCSAWVARRTRRLWLLIGARRLQFEPGAPSRVVAGLVVVVFGMGFAIGLARDAEATAAPFGPYEVYSLSASEVPAMARRAVVRLPEVKAAAIVLPSAVREPQPGEPLSAENLGIWAVFAHCDDFTRFVGHALHGCSEGRAYRLIHTDGPPPLFDISAGTTFRFPTTFGGRSLSVTVPEAVLRAPDTAPFAADLLLPPELLASGIPATAEIVLLSRSDPTTVNAVASGIARLAPAAHLRYVNDDLASRLHAHTFRRLLSLALVLGVSIGLASFVVASIDRAIERRSELVALQVVGVPARTLRATQAAQVGLLLVVGLLLAAVCGKLAEQLTVAAGGLDRSWTWSDLLIGMGAGLVGLLVATVASAAAIARRIDPALIRRE